MDDEVVCKSIVEKFETLGASGVSYAEIAQKAWEVGRTELATKVCLHCKVAHTVGLSIV